MVSVCKTVTYPSRKIIIKCTGKKMTCFQLSFLHNRHGNKRKISDQIKLEYIPTKNTQTVA